MMETITILPKIDIKNNFNFITFPNKNYNNINFVMRDMKFLEEKKVKIIHYEDPTHSQR